MRASEFVRRHANVVRGTRIGPHRPRRRSEDAGLHADRSARARDRARLDTAHRHSATAVIDRPKESQPRLLRFRVPAGRAKRAEALPDSQPERRSTPRRLDRQFNEQGPMPALGDADDPGVGTKIAEHRPVHGG